MKEKSPEPKLAKENVIVIPELSQEAQRALMKEVETDWDQLTNESSGYPDGPGVDTVEHYDKLAKKFHPEGKYPNPKLSDK